ncbi:hypothetical protein OAN00_02045 [Pseudomonadales bacterium]|nr:hypothetical protein [Pseudomonadales bacterium]MDC0374332.1 hypothetical protein [Pseudomonadales bacterium]
MSRELGAIQLSLQTFISIKAEASRFAGETAQGVCTVERFLLIAYAIGIVI